MTSIFAGILNSFPDLSWAMKKSMTLENLLGSQRPAILTKLNGTGCLTLSNKTQGGANLYQNLGNDLCLQNNNWYYIEMRMKTNTPGNTNGIFELWIDNCGTDGLGCTGSGTKRTSRADVDWGNTGDLKLGTVWHENWGNPGSTGEEYYDQMIVATKRIGPVGVTILSPPPPPPLVGDLNNDNTVNSLDWGIMNAVWFTSDPVADLNNDGLVNTIDFSMLNQNWGK